MRPLCQCGEIGRHAGFKIRFLCGSGGSSPPTGTTNISRSSSTTSSLIQSLEQLRSAFIYKANVMASSSKKQKKISPTPKIQVEHAGLMRRLAALLYDCFLVGAIWFVLAGIIVIIHHGEAMPVWANQIILLPLLILSAFLFYFWFWTHGGQTLGMRAWRLKILSSEKTTPSFQQCFIRFSIALLSGGFGFLVCLFNQDKKSLQDLLSHTQIILLPKETQYAKPN